ELPITESQRLGAAGDLQPPERRVQIRIEPRRVLADNVELAGGGDLRRQPAHLHALGRSEILPRAAHPLGQCRARESTCGEHRGPPQEFAPGELGSVVPRAAGHPCATPRERSSVPPSTDRRDSGSRSAPTPPRPPPAAAPRRAPTWRSSRSTAAAPPAAAASRA